MKLIRSRELKIDSTAQNGSIPKRMKTMKICMESEFLKYLLKTPLKEAPQEFLQSDFDHKWKGWQITDHAHDALSVWTLVNNTGLEKWLKSNKN